MTDTDALPDRGSDGRGRKDRAEGNVFSRLALFIRQVVAELHRAELARALRGEAEDLRVAVAREADGDRVLGGGDGDRAVGGVVGRDQRLPAHALAEPDQLDEWQPDVAIVGAPFDISTTNRPGARFGPRALRAQAYYPSAHHLDLDIEIFENLEVVDFGDAHCPHGLTERSHDNIRARVSEIASRGIFPVIIGGDHSITWPAATAVDAKVCRRS